MSKPLAPICTKCGLEMRPHKNGVLAVLMAYGQFSEDGKTITPPVMYESYRGDLVKCPDCGMEVICNYGGKEWQISDEGHALVPDLTNPHVYPVWENKKRRNEKRTEEINFREAYRASRESRIEDILRMLVNTDFSGKFSVPLSGEMDNYPGFIKTAIDVVCDEMLTATCPGDPYYGMDTWPIIQEMHKTILIEWGLLSADDYLEPGGFDYSDGETL